MRRHYATAGQNGGCANSARCDFLDIAEITRKLLAKLSIELVIITGALVQDEACHVVQ